MPPHQTDVTSKAERDAAGLGFDLPIALAKDEARAAARLNVPIAALDDALPEKEAAGPLATSVLSLLRQYWRAFQERRQRQGLRTDLYRLSDRELTDIGLTRGEIDYIRPERAIETLRDRTRYLWGRGGM